MKEKFLIKGLGGKKKLKGEISVRGSKNAVLPAMASSLLFKDDVSFSNVPVIEDVFRMIELMEELGGKISRNDNRAFKINTNSIKKFDLESDIAKKMRASIILSGPLLARFGKVSFPYPGGCVIGTRPIDLFLEGFQKMGAKVSEKSDRYHIRAPKEGLKGAEIFFKVQSVTATESFILAGVLAKGKTVLKNCAMEPEVKSIADFLESCGAKIKGAGTPTIEIQGGGLLSAKGKKYKTIPDRLEAGSFLILGAMCADNLLIKDCNPSDLEILIEALRQSGVKIEAGNSTIKISGNSKHKNSSFKALNIKTHEYPGFPTDLQAPMTVFLTQVSGESVIFETIFEGRLNYTEDLVKMGADIVMWDSHRVQVKGPAKLRGREVDGPDIRAGLAFVLAGIVAKGKSVINNAYYIDRGYERIEERLRDIGVDIKRIKD